MNPVELWDEAVHRQRVLARRHVRLAGLCPDTPAYEHQAERVFAAADELLVVLDEIEQATVRRRLAGAAALIVVGVILAVIAAVGTISTVLWCAAAIAVAAACLLALSSRWRTT